MKNGSRSHLADDIGDAVESTLDDGRAAAADGLKGAARGLHRRADAITVGAERVSAVTHKVADRVDSASRYVRHNDGRDMLADVESIVRRHPAKSLLAAIAVGYLAARALRDD